jgi:hypothetical protein
MVFDSLRDDIEKDAYVDYFGTGYLNLNSPLLVGVKRKSRLSGQRGMNSNKV